MKWFRCIHCGESKDENCFYNDKHKPSGKKPRCKACDKLSLNMERRREYEKEYRQKNSARRYAIVKKSMKKNAEHHKEKRRQYLQTPEGRRAHRKQTQNRVARVKAAFVEAVDVVELYEAQNGICYLCAGFFELSEMECDHVIPLSRGGKHQKSNCKMACITCNRSKGAKLLEELTYQVV